MTEVETLTELEACERLRLESSRVEPGKCVVEVGVYRGGSLRYLADGARPGVRVYGIDPWGMPGAYPGRAHMLRRYLPEDQAIAAAHVPEASLIRDFGTEVARLWEGEPVGLLFIDAIHREREVIADLTAWVPHLAHDAVVAFDDHSIERFPGVVSAVAKLERDLPLVDREIVGSRLAVFRWRP